MVFLNSAGERMVLVRDGFKVIDLAQCGLANHQRFTFYDHVHTTGMDIKQPLACTACLTFSKDTPLRDYSQGAYRMRGIGRGQRIELLLIPEETPPSQSVCFAFHSRPPVAARLLPTT